MHSYSYMTVSNRFIPLSNTRMQSRDSTLQHFVIPCQVHSLSCPPESKYKPMWMGLSTSRQKQKESHFWLDTFRSTSLLKWSCEYSGEHINANEIGHMCWDRQAEWYQLFSQNESAECIKKKQNSKKAPSTTMVSRVPTWVKRPLQQAEINKGPNQPAPAIDKPEQNRDLIEKWRTRNSWLMEAGQAQGNL